MWAINKLRDYKELSRDAIFPNKPVLTENNLPNLKGKVYVVTGASAGIGKETALLLLKAGARVWIIGRTESKLESTKQELQEFGDVKVLQIKMEDPATIADDIKPLLNQETQIDGVVHNAGMNYRGSFYACGYLDVLTVNVLGPWVLQKYLNPLVLAAAAKSEPGAVRVVWVASAAHYFSPQCGGIEWDNLNSESINGPMGFGIYGQTKAMNIYQAYWWAKEHPDSNVVSVSAHPGTVDSEIRRYRPDRNRNMASLCVPTVYGAYAEIAALLSDRITPKDTGTYWRPYAAPGRIRPDVEEALKGPRGEKFVRWLEEQVDSIEQKGPQGPAKEVSS